MGRPKLTIRETKIAQRVIDRKILLKKASIMGYKRPEGFGYFDDEVKVEAKVEKKVEATVEAAVEPTIEASVDTVVEKKVVKKAAKKAEKTEEEKSE